MQFVDWLDAVDLWRAIPLLVLGWLALFFGRTLRPGKVPLIEQIARVREPELGPSLCLYTRRLTALWTAYFVLAALLSLAVDLQFAWIGGLVWLGAVVLFVGEHRCRPLLFPGQSFPSLREQVLDTASVWRRGS